MADLKTPVFDWDAGDFALDLQRGVRAAIQGEAVAQIILKATQTIRGAFLIYANREQPQLNHKFGSDARYTAVMDITEAARVSEISRNIQDALIYDPWIIGVRDIVITREPQTDKDTGARKWVYVASCTVDHIYGTTEIEGVIV
ncbi:DUF2634 domain-containing protein [Paenibacillus sp. BK720]|uniref:DUF2634 domain-containing protein n=1 Tax=Paenibacillus sp. BK720 TaxID=2587092 RepID=UPI001422BAF9|nr:DUF2634 domain-containing protein [Paenibacillus sp. BK720]NIK67942.1 hypothetical protein [Paenibacillus sp. BK720]